MTGCHRENVRPPNPSSFDASFGFVGSLSTPDSVSVSLNRERNVRECGRAVGKNNESLFHLRRDGTLRGRAATLPVAISVVVSEAMASSIATHAREAVASERGTRATRLGLTPARGDATGSQAADATKRGAPGAPVRRVVSEEDLEAAELMCSLRDVIEPPATRDVRRRRPADAPNPSKLPAPRRTLPAPERRGMPKSAFGEGAKNKRGIGRVESLLTRARGVARQLAPPFPALKRCGSITEALAYIDAQPPSGAPVDGRERRLPRKRRREPSREETAKSPFPTPPSPRSLSRDRVPPRVPSPPGTPTERPTPKPLGYRPRLPRARRRAPREPRRQSRRGDRRHPVVRKRRRRRRGKRRRGKRRRKSLNPEAP